MVDFWVYDVGFLVVFTAFVIWFLSKRKKSLSKEGRVFGIPLIFMYRSQAGVRAINYVGDNFKGLLNFLKYIIIAVGVGLMGIMVWMLGQTLSLYITQPELVSVIKAPPIAPLIPYFPKLFGMESFFPPFYFTYFILALAVVAIVHEFSHGVFMRLFKVRIKSTGMVFLGPIIGAFVEQDDKSFQKKKKLEQMTVLGAGVFANVLTALLFYGLYVLFFYSSFTASGAVFGDYAMMPVLADNVTISVDGNTTEVITANGVFNFYGGADIQVGPDGNNYLVGYIESPAILSQMRGAIIQADDVKINNFDKLIEFIQTKNPGDEVTFITEDADGRNEYVIEMGENPIDSSVAFLGISQAQMNPRGIVQGFFAKFMSFKEPSTYYLPSWDGDFVYFIYHFLWWVMVINLLVALFNMMPLGMLDGGRFFYLALWGITRSEKFAKRAFKFATYAIALVFVLLMFFWFIRVV